MSLNDDNICSICYNSSNIEEFKCRTCKYSLCIDCLCKITNDKFEFKEQLLDLNYKCPVCRDIYYISIIEFKKEDIIKVANINYRLQEKEFYDKFRNYISIIDNNKADVDRARDQIKINNEKCKKINDENKKLKDEIENLKVILLNNGDIINLLKSYIKNQKNNLKYICETNKGTTINKKILEPFYNNIIDICI